MNQNDQYKAFLENQQLAREAGCASDRRIRHSLRCCASKLEDVAQEFMPRTSGLLTHVLMRQALENQVARCGFVPPHHALPFGREALGHHWMSTSKDALTAGPVVVCGSAYPTLLEYACYLIAHL